MGISSTSEELTAVAAVGAEGAANGPGGKPHKISPPWPERENVSELPHSALRVTAIARERRLLAHTLAISAFLLNSLGKCL